MVMKLLPKVVYSSQDQNSNPSRLIHGLHVWQEFWWDIINMVSQFISHNSSSCYLACSRINFIVSVLISQKLSLWIRNRTILKYTTQKNNISETNGNNRSRQIIFSDSIQKLSETVFYSSSQRQTVRKLFLRQTHQKQLPRLEHQKVSNIQRKMFKIKLIFLTNNITCSSQSKY